MFHRLGHVTYRRRGLVLALAGLFLAFGAVWGTGVFGSMVSSGFDTPGSESARAQARTEATVGRGAADVVVLYRDGGRPVGDPAFRAAVEDHLADLPTDLVASTTTYWTAGPAASRFVSDDRPIDVRRPAARRRGRRRADGVVRGARADPARGAPGAGRPARRQRGDRQRHHHAGRRGHRPRRVAVDADPARPARRHLRRSDRGQPAAGHRRPGDPRCLHHAAGAQSGHRRVGLLDQHRHHAGSRPGDRLRAVRRVAGSARRSAPARTPSRRWSPRWQRRGAPSRSPG